MAKWQFGREGTWDYPTLGIEVSTGDVIESGSAPDAYWTLVGDEIPATVFPAVEVPMFSETTDGYALTYDATGNRYVPADLDAVYGKWRKTTSGEWRASHRMLSDSTRVITTGVMFAVGEYLPPGTIDRLAIEVTTAATAASGSVARLGIASDNGFSRPGALLDSMGTVSLDTLGVQELATSAPVEHDGGFIWFYVVGQGIVGTPAIRGVNAAGLDMIGAFSAPTAAAVLTTAIAGGPYQASITAALPDPMVITAYTGSIPRVAYRFTPA